VSFLNSTLSFDEQEEQAVGRDQSSGEGGGGVTGRGRGAEGSGAGEGDGGEEVPAGRLRAGECEGEQVVALNRSFIAP
jgi:hypothetical protein